MSDSQPHQPESHRLMQRHTLGLSGHAFHGPPSEEFAAIRNQELDAVDAAIQAAEQKRTTASTFNQPLGGDNESD